ncbi:MAG: allantoate amidohydrolase [Pseudomonadota bacterium]
MPPVELPAAVECCLPAAHRVMARCDELAQLSSMADGIQRLYLSAEQQETNAVVSAWMQEVGLKTRIDAAGSLIGESAQSKSTQPWLLLGSHLDTVPNAGRYDGILGVLLGIEAAHNCRDLPLNYEVIGFAEEEGVRFGTTLMTSRARAGSWDSAWWSLTDKQGETVAEAFNANGLDPDDIASACPAKNLLAYLEVHIEQGPILQDADLPLGVVDSIAAAQRFTITIEGRAGHAGTVPMSMRQDALVGAAHCILLAQRLSQELGMTATVGKVQAHPGAVNVISGRVELSLDARSVDEAMLERFVESYATAARALLTKENLSMQMTTIHQAGAAHCAGHIQEAMHTALSRLPLASTTISSGAGHDAMAMQDVCDIGMLFVRCKDGISHNPAESVTVEDVAWALCALQFTIEEIAAKL